MDGSSFIKAIAMFVSSRKSPFIEVYSLASGLDCIDHLLRVLWGQCTRETEQLGARSAFRFGLDKGCGVVEDSALQVWGEQIDLFE
jgi:hypothetical protein